MADILVMVLQSGISMRRITIHPSLHGLESLLVEAENLEHERKS